MKATRKQAAEELYAVIAIYEKVKFSTVYRHCFYYAKTNVWRYIGRAHDYTY